MRFISRQCLSVSDQVKGDITSGRPSPKLLRDQRYSPVRLSFHSPVSGLSARSVVMGRD